MSDRRTQFLRRLTAKHFGSSSGLRIYELNAGCRKSNAPVTREEIDRIKIGEERRRKCTAIYFAPFNQLSISSIYWPV